MVWNASVQPYLVLPSHTPSSACLARIMDYWLRQRLSNSWVAPVFRYISETTDEERQHVELGTINLLPSNSKMRFLAPGDWIRIKFDLLPLVRHACWRTISQFETASW